MSPALIDRLAVVLAAHLGTAIRILRRVPVHGGSINDAYRLETNAGPFFVKVNTAARHPPEGWPSLFAAEVDGLERLRNTHVIRVPQMIAIGEEEDDSFLLLEHIEAQPATREHWQRFGRSLAQLHSTTQDHFGLDSNNYIGSLPQVNTPEQDWPTFFLRHRLEPLVKATRDAHAIDGGMALRFEQLCNRLGDLFPPEPPTLLHGDLWSGNFLCSASDRPVLFDPAVYFGHREMDIAMTTLFGGFDTAFYVAYNDESPLEKGWEERVDLCNLYPLLVHVNLFGGGYVQQLEAALRRFV